MVRHVKSSTTVKTEQIFKIHSYLFFKGNNKSNLLFVSCGQREQCGSLKGTDTAKQDLMLWTGGLNPSTR